MSKDKKKKRKVVKNITKKGAILLDGDFNKKGSKRISKEEFESRHGRLKGHLQNVDGEKDQGHTTEKQRKEGEGKATKL